MIGCLPRDAWQRYVITEVSHIGEMGLRSYQVLEPLLSVFEMVYPPLSFHSSEIRSEL